MFTLVKRWKIQISHRTEACWSVKLYSTWCRYNLPILYLTHKAIKVSSYHAAPLSGCRAESVNQPLEIWKRRQTGLLDLITVQTDPEAAVSQLRTQRKWRHTEHHSSFFLFHLLRNIRAGRQTCFGFDQRETFSMSLCWAENVQQSLLPVRTTKEDTVRQNCDVLGHNKDFSVSPFCSASVRNGIDSAHSECQSAWTQFLTDEVCLSLSGEWGHLWLHCRAGPSGTRTKIWGIAVYFPAQMCS